MTYRLIHGNCMDVLPTLTGIDAVVTDPPYGIGENDKKVASRDKLAKHIDYGTFNWDTERVGVNVIEKMRSVSLKQVIWGGNYYADVLPASSGWIVWDKQNGNNDFSDCELAWTSFHKGVRIIRYLWNGMIKAKPEKRYHPTQKPLDVMRWVIVNYTNPGDTVLDPYMGSGSTGVAAILEGRDFIGIEIDKGYYDIACKRCAEAAAQPKLFDVAEVVEQPKQAQLYL